MNFWEFDCYHGTNAESEAGIRAEGFRKSLGEDHWLGEGVYFFTDGCPNPPEEVKFATEGCSNSAADDARYWAQAQAYCKEKSANTYSRYVVLRCVVKAAKVFDLRDPEAHKIFNATRDEIYKKIEVFGASFKNKHSDTAILRYIYNNIFKFEAALGNFYIKRTAQRKLKLQSLIPNSTVLCFWGPVTALDRDSLETVESGDVPV